MKVVMKQFFQSLLLAGIYPAVMISSVSNAYSKIDSPVIVPKPPAKQYEITVIDQAGDPRTMELEEYISCVILGEISTQFHTEAIKAQAVAARSYALYCIDVLQKHSIGAVCTDYHCCQAYCEPDDYLKQGGTEQELAKVTEAVENTAGEVLYYNSKLICATYFASSGGQTEDAVEVWGKAYPYLQAVESPGEEDCGYFSEQLILTAFELKDALGVSLTGNPDSWFGMVRYTPGGGVDLMRIGGRLYTGVELRKLLKLRSTIMAISVKNDTITIDTKGYGHRVGLSQHGANAMAKNGSDYCGILKHYYTDVTILPYEEESDPILQEND